jgi:hypothetical protein
VTGPPSRARRVFAAAALALALGLASQVARGEVRRFEVVGAVPVEPGAPPPGRQAALRAALEEAALQAARVLFETEAPGRAPPSDLAAAIGSPEDYAVSYRLVEDRGEQPALVTPAAPGGHEYVVVAEVEVNLGRLRDRLRERGRLAGAPVPAGPTRFRLELLDLPSPRAYTAVRNALAGAGATMIPVELEPRRALVEVSGLTEPVALERLRTSPLPELWVEPLGPESPGAPARVRVHRGAPPGAPLALEAPGDASDSPPDAGAAPSAQPDAASQDGAGAPAEADGAAGAAGDAPADAPVDPAGASPN